MSEKDKVILIAKIDTLRMSINDNQLDTLCSLLRDLVASISCEPDKTAGFEGK